jgi:hypothetical protein
VRRAFLLLLAVLLLPGTAEAHSYRDPALRSVLDEVRPALPAGVSVTLQPSVVDELVLSNTTDVPLEVLGRDGAPFLRLRRGLVEADVAHPDWYLTALPEGAPDLPAFARTGAPARWRTVATTGTWSEFDPRVRPPVTVSSELRAAGRRRVLTSWSVPLRYGGAAVAVTGQVLLEPVRGGLVVATSRVPAGLTATPLQGELPGLFLRVPAGRTAVVLGTDGQPFLSFAGGTVRARVASPSWRADQRARGREVTGTGWVVVARAPSYSWLDPRLRYPRDVPPEDVVGRTSVVQRWAVPVLLDGARTEVSGTVTWVPRADALRALRPAQPSGVRHRGWLLLGVVAALLGGLGAVLVIRRRPGVRKAGDRGTMRT